MEVKDIDTLLEKLKSIQMTFGIGGVVLVIALVIIAIFGWRYLNRSVEIIAEEASEKSLKKFQSQIDKDLIKFQTKHQKQVDAIHDTFQKFQRLTSAINYTMHGEKFTQPIKPQEETKYLVQFRHDFKDIYLQNKLIFPIDLCKKIDALIPTVDNFIETYISGIMPEPSEEDKEFYAENNGGSYIAGFWGMNAFEDSLGQLEEISTEIEAEFRKIYGTNE